MGNLQDKGMGSKGCSSGLRDPALKGLQCIAFPIKPRPTEPSPGLHGASKKRGDTETERNGSLYWEFRGVTRQNGALCSRPLLPGDARRAPARPSLGFPYLLGWKSGTSTPLLQSSASTAKRLQSSKGKKGRTREEISLRRRAPQRGTRGSDPRSEPRVRAEPRGRTGKPAAPSPGLSPRSHGGAAPPGPLCSAAPGIRPVPASEGPAAHNGGGPAGRAGPGPLRLPPAARRQAGPLPPSWPRPPFLARRGRPRPPARPPSLTCGGRALRQPEAGPGPLGRTAPGGERGPVGSEGPPRNGEAGPGRAGPSGARREEEE